MRSSIINIIIALITLATTIFVAVIGYKNYSYLLLSERPVLTLINPMIAKNLQDNPKIIKYKITLSFKNIGKRIASNIEILLASAIKEHPESLMPLRNQSYSNPLNPNEKKDFIGPTIQFTKSEKQWEGPYLYILVKYKDSLDQTKKYYSELLYKLSPDLTAVEDISTDEKKKIMPYVLKLFGKNRMNSNIECLYPEGSITINPKAFDHIQNKNH